MPNDVNNTCCGCGPTHLLHTEKDVLIVHYKHKHWSIGCLITHLETKHERERQIAVHGANEMRAKYVHMRKLYEGELDETTVLGGGLHLVHDYLKKYGDHTDACTLRKFAESGRLPPKHLQKCTCGFNDALCEVLDIKKRK
jgi:hypothetical protein